MKFLFFFLLNLFNYYYTKVFPVDCSKSLDLAPCATIKERGVLDVH